ncbi:MAG: helix-turn-helix transcriptional regulator, partial [Candidatus Eremiobacteraeota bacterium]|nr:helix-turn-helix transcriptional regulator [Candidatus Eremiobacteraeota bacterium]
MIPTGQRNHTGVEETRAKIISAARELFERNGTRGTTTREVAERAGVNEATLFRHFGSKRALLDAMREQACGVEEFRSILASLPGEELATDLRLLA